jgi:hypothetical protein
MNSRAGFVYSIERPNNAEMTMATKPHDPASYFLTPDTPKGPADPAGPFAFGCS